MADNTPQVRKKPKFKDELGFGLIHIIPILMIWTGATTFDWLLCAFLYFFRMFWITAGYHRYFAHKTFQTSRFFQFVIAFFAQTSLQKGALWWAANHRIHHKFSDTPEDPHSNKIYGFFYSQIGWIIGPDYKETRLDLIRDFASFKELVWLNKNHLIPPLVMLMGCFFIGGYINGGQGLTFNDAFISGGLSTVVVGFFTSTVILFHGTFTINSLTHMIGKARYESDDKSKNHFLLAIITMGEGWHNNHHYFQSTVQQGFFWWEWDPTYYILRFLSWFGIVWDLRTVPKHIKYSKNKEHAKQLKEEFKQKEAA